jgi:hypothetical protein
MALAVTLVKPKRLAADIGTTCPFLGLQTRSATSPTPENAESCSFGAISKPALRNIDISKIEWYKGNRYENTQPASLLYLP